MAKSGLITVEKILETKKTNQKYNKFTSAPKSTRYFIDWLLPRVKSYLGEVKEDLIVRTTLDVQLQKIAEDSVNKITLDYPSAGQSAIVAMNLDGGVLSMIGGRDYGDSQFNRVTQAQRQPGSAFKVFVYLAGLKGGFSPDDFMIDSKIDINGWSPQNYKKEYVGEVSLNDAFAKSINTVAVKLSEEVGRENVIKVAKSLGISSCIHWRGAQNSDKVITALRQADIFVLPCRRDIDGNQDGLPNVLMEAQSQGLAVASTNIAAIPELISHSETGILVPPNDPSALQEGLVSLITSPNLRFKFGKAGEKRVRMRFNAEQNLDTLARLLSGSSTEKVKICK